jgi:nucleoside-diphosphate-sugar epimerase
MDLLNHSKVGEWLRKERPEVIFHFAGTMGRGDETGEECEQLNFQATASLLTYAGEIDCQRIIILGSADEYGHHAGRQHEDLPQQPISHYAVSKTKSTRFALEKYRETGLPVVVLRIFSAYGAGQPAQMFVAQALDCALNGKVFEMTEGVQKRDLVFIEDAIRGVLTSAIAPQASGKIINLATGEATALRDVAKLIWKLTDADSELLKIGARTATNAENHDTWADIERAREILDWQPRVTLEDGLRRTIKIMRAEFLQTA